MIISVFDRVEDNGGKGENNVGKGENAGYQNTCNINDNFCL